MTSNASPTINYELARFSQNEQAKVVLIGTGSVEPAWWRQTLNSKQMSWLRDLCRLAGTTPRLTVADILGNDPAETVQRLQQLIDTDVIDVQEIDADAENTSVWFRIDIYDADTCATTDSTPKCGKPYNEWQCGIKTISWQCQAVPGHTGDCSPFNCR